MLTKYVALTCSSEDIDRNGLKDKLPIPKGTTTLNSFITNGKDSQFQNKEMIKLLSNNDKNRI